MKEEHTPTGWASPDLARAYFAVDTAMRTANQPVESGIHEALKAALDAIETADCELEKFAPKPIADWWKPNPGDPFWMLESADGEWLRNEASGALTRSATDALRFPSEVSADRKRRALPHPLYGELRATEHTWATLPTPQIGPSE